MAPKITDNDRDEITATIEGKEVRGWSYQSENERRVKMRMAHEFAEGWYQAERRLAETPSVPDEPEAAA